LWGGHIKDWQQSGLSQADYCRQNKLPDHQLTYWKKRILKKEPTVSFIPLVLPGQQPSNYRGIRVTTPNGFTIEIDGGIETTALKQLIAGVAAL
jgi:hypothetical protein